jgi:hypothetical protein
MLRLYLPYYIELFSSNNTSHFKLHRSVLPLLIAKETPPEIIATILIEVTQSPPNLPFTSRSAHANDLVMIVPVSP